MLWDNSGSLTVTICQQTGNPVPVATALSPATVTAGGTGLTVTVTGTGFVPASEVHWNGTLKTTTYVDASHLQVALAAGDVATAGANAVTVFNPEPIGGTSAALTFEVVPAGQTCSTPVTVLAAPGGSNPTLATMWQATGVTVHPGDTVTVTATGTWTNGGVTTSGAGDPAVTMSGADCPKAGQKSMALIGRVGTSGTPFLVGASGQFTATTTAMLYLAPNDNWYTLWDNSGSLSVTICIGTNNPLPVATSLAPATVAAGAPGVTLNVTGSGFVAASHVQWNGSDRPTTYVSATLLQAAVSPSDVSTTGTNTVTVVNPAPGGGTSAGVPFVVTVPGQSTATVVAAPNAGSPSLVGMWQSTGVTIQVGDSVTVTPSGTWTSAGVTTGGAGDPAVTMSGTNCPMAGQKSMVLIGRIGSNGASWLVGGGTTFVANAAGTLYLAPNDEWYLLWDNSGSPSVTILVTRPEPEPASEAGMVAGGGGDRQTPSGWPSGEPVLWCTLAAVTAVAGRRRLAEWRWRVGSALSATRSAAGTSAWPFWIGLPMVMVVLTPRAAQAQADPVEYYHLDALGSVRAVTNSNGDVIRLHDFKPFGEEITTPSTADRKLFTGQERDHSTGLDYVGARYYRPDLGRFTSADDSSFLHPFEPRSGNLYAHAFGNPLRWVDPTGHDPCGPYGTDYCVDVNAPMPPDDGLARFFLESLLRSWQSFFPDVYAQGGPSEMPSNLPLGTPSSFWVHFSRVSRQPRRH